MSAKNYKAELAALRRQELTVTKLLATNGHFYEDTLRWLADAAREHNVPVPLSLDRETVLDFAVAYLKTCDWWDPDDGSSASLVVADLLLGLDPFRYFPVKDDGLPPETPLKTLRLFVNDTFAKECVRAGRKVWDVGAVLSDEDLNQAIHKVLVSTETEGLWQAAADADLTAKLGPGWREPSANHG